MSRVLDENLTGVQHIGIPTKDIEGTIGYYEKLGFKTAFRRNEGGDNVAFLQLGNLMLETYAADETAGKSGAVDHIAIDVKDIGQVYDEIVRMGLNNMKDQVNFLPFWENGVKFFTIEGPNGEHIEFNQKL